MVKLKNSLIFLPPILLTLFVFFPLYFDNKLFQGITSLQIDYSQKDYFFSTFSWIYSLNLLGEPLLANPNNGVVSLQALTYTIFPVSIAYKLNFILGFSIFYYFSYEILKKNTTKSISILTPLVILSSPLLISSTQRLSFWPIVWCAPFIYTYLKAINKGQWFYYAISGLILSRTLSLGDPFLFILLPTLVHIILAKRPTKNILVTILFFIIGTAPFLSFYFELQPLMARHYGQPEHIAFKHSLNFSKILELFTNRHLSPNSTNNWFSSLSIGLGLSIISAFTLLKSPKRVTILVTGIISTFIFLSFGSNLEISRIIQSSLPVMDQLRYPEKYVLYILICFTTLIYLRPQALDKKVFKVLLTLALLESLVSTPKIKYINQESITKKNFLKDYQGIKTRVKICPNGLRQVQNGETPNLRAFGVATLNSTSNISSTALKMITCKAIVEPTLAKRLGISHILFSNLSNNERKIITKNNWVLDRQDSAFSIYKLQESSPLMAYRLSQPKLGQFLKYKGVDYIKNKKLDWSKEIISNSHSINEISLSTHSKNRGNFLDNLETCKNNNPVTLKASYNSQKFEAFVDSKCRSILNIPWYFTPGWKAYNNDKETTIYRINDITMGIELNNGINNIELLYLPSKWPFLFSYLVIIILISLPIVLKLKRFIFSQKG